MRRLAAHLLTIVFLGSVLLWTGEAAALEKGYKQALKRWTRSYGYYIPKDLNAPFVWSATYLGRDYLAARADEEAHRYRWSEDTERRALEEGLALYTPGPAFFIALYTKENKWNDLNKADSVWRLYLRQAGKSCEPAAITRIAKPSPEDLYFFPYVERWDIAYTVSFPGTCALADDKPFELELTGLYGHSTLQW